MEETKKVERRYMWFVGYPVDVQQLLKEHRVIYMEMVKEDVRKIVAESGYPGVEGLAFLHRKAYEFPPEDLVIAFIERVKPELLDELAEKGLYKRD